MRVPILISASAFLFACGLTPALAQLSGGLGAANSANQSFQQQNQLRGAQQQQNFNANQNRLQNSTNQLNSGPRVSGSAVVPRSRANRPERER